MSHRIGICWLTVFFLASSVSADAQSEADVIRQRVKASQKVSITTGLGVGAAFAVTALAIEDAGCDPHDAAGFFGCGNPGAGGYAAGALILGGRGAAESSCIA